MIPMELLHYHILPHLCTLKDTQTLRSCTLVNKKWCRFASMKLWSDVHIISSRQLYLFMRSLEMTNGDAHYSSFQATWINSIFVNYNENDANSESDGSDPVMAPLFATLSLLPNLTQVGIWKEVDIREVAEFALSSKSKESVRRLIFPTLTYGSGRISWMSQKLLIATLTSFRHLTHLEIGSALLDDRVMGEMMMVVTSLKKLVIHAVSGEFSHISLLHLSQHSSHLMVLSLDLMGISDCAQHHRIITQGFGALLTGCSNLTAVVLKHVKFDGRIRHRQLQTDNGLMMLQHFLSFKQLESISLWFCSGVVQFALESLLQLISSAHWTSLKRFELTSCFPYTSNHLLAPPFQL